MGSAFPHVSYLSAAIALAFGGLAMSVGVISGDTENLRSLLNGYLYAMGIAVLALAGRQPNDEDD